MSTYLIVVLAYFGLITLISILTKKVASRSAADYLVAGRNLGVIACAVVVASEWLGGMSTIGVSEKSFTSGTLQPILYNISTAIGMIIIGYTVARHYRQNNVHTVSEMLGRLFGKRAKAISAIAFLFAYIVLAFVQLQTASSVISAMFELPWVTSVIISSVVITIYTYIGGMHALAITGIIHVVVMFGGIGFAAFTGITDIGGFAALKADMVALGSPENLYNPFSGGLGYAWSLIIGGVLGGMAGQASIQPIFAARSADIAKKAAILSSLIIAPFGIMVAILGLVAKTGNYFDVTTAASPLWNADLGIINPKMVLPTLMVTPEFIHPVMGGIALAGILAAILSTVGPVNFAVVTIATKDIYHGIINKSAVDQKIISTARKLVILVNLITIPLAIYSSGAILSMAYISYGIRAIGAIVIVLGIYKRGWISTDGVRFAFIGGTVAVLVNIIAKLAGWWKMEDTYVAVIAAVVCIILGNIYANKRKREIRAKGISMRKPKDI
ncbi:MAG: sodium:solute symporter family protein [Tenuifilaceae bacterium]|jgi:SSS family solute:Na+ symporter|nr:sodium:solute symporter family protein [Tenuifilaceae bacterium]